MFRGFYTLASGMLTQQRTLDTISNNVANVKTAGYKRKILTSSTFDQQLIARIQTNDNKKLGKGCIVRYADKVYTDYNQSGLTDTESPFDIALVGDGFFKVENVNSEKPLLTRNGSFSVDEEGYLISSNGSRLLGEGGPIQVGGGDFVVDEGGYVYVGTEDSPVDRIGIAYPADTKNLTTYSEGYYIDNNPDNAQNEEKVYSTAFLQGKIESSNVDMSEETSSLMETSRTFQTYSQALKIVDKINAKSVTEIAKR
ncbi:flagellar hook-basal body protein [Acetanaerobacterium elongatum]|uniref:Flagellar basal-body rod protein FlgG n=1 Tax=Acetanaerobacterium elongatum TaxID=258515 RepID=A0A1G9ZDT2_9FIRM|nr:flagellar hook-basal body protein [Acetanaerobacterium elongatum]SDN19600.1 flagellar basal-body rod protein FlgG [Acetanaerobacterium elongatum]